VNNTLLVDGDNLFKIGFHGVKDLYNEGNHVGGVFHFINTIRKFLEEHECNRVVVFWDGENGSSSRKQLYSEYKSNRRNDMNEDKYESYLTQKRRVKQYLEEVFIRQVECQNNEADDLISYYTQISTDENIIIFSADKDLTQLISDRVKIYSPTSKSYYGYGDMIYVNKVGIPHQNVLLCKIFTGDKSDNIEGVQGLGEKTLVKLFPQISTSKCSVDEIIESAKLQFEIKKSKVLENILTGKSKSNIFGKKLYILNSELVDLSKPLITDDAKKIVEQIYSDTIDPTDRGHRNLMRLMIEDGLFKYLPKNDNEWVNFLKPFTKLIRKEKRKL